MLTLQCFNVWAESGGTNVEFWVSKKAKVSSLILQIHKSKAVLRKDSKKVFSPQFFLNNSAEINTIMMMQMTQ